MNFYLHSPGNRSVMEFQPSYMPVEEAVEVETGSSFTSTPISNSSLQTGQCGSFERWVGVIITVGRVSIAVLGAGSGPGLTGVWNDYHRLPDPSSWLVVDQAAEPMNPVTLHLMMALGCLYVKVA
ncbi:hypothetical protein Leryth_007221 [Lithospermum erythrorhizon]|nr:hypothetical protein Leryth_007221 [Lithospermum erythrorhizon]